MKRRKFLLSATGALLALPGTSVFGVPGWADIDSVKLKPGQVALNESPTRYAFVADKFSNFISIVDIVSGDYIETLDLGFRPQVFEMARDDAMMAIGSPEVSGICFFNLTTRERRFLRLPAPVYQIFFVPQSKLVAVGLRDRVGMIDYESFSVHIFSRRFDSPQRQTVLDTFYSLLFSSFSRTFWILDEERPRIFRRHFDQAARNLDAAEDVKNAKSGQVKKAATKPLWKEIDFSRRIKSRAGFGIGIASPEDHLLALTVDDGSEGLIYFPETDTLRSTGPMRTVGTTNEPMIRPYIDANTQRVIFADVEGNVALFDLTRDAAKPQRFRVDFSPRVIRSGWLESTWLLGGDKALLFQSFDDPDDRKLFRFRAQVVDMWVTGDSKTALVTIDEQLPQIFRYDIHTREMLAPVRVPRITMAGSIRMGSNNSLCY